MVEEEEILEVLDRRHRLIGYASRGSVHRFGLRHRSVHVMVFDPAGRLYLQLRAAHKDRFPGHWDTSAAGHVSPGEDYAAAAVRELEEELGLRADLLWWAAVPACPATGWEYTAMFICCTSAAPRPNPAEIEAGRFFTPMELDGLLQDPSAAVTPACRRLWALWRERTGTVRLNPGAPPTCD